MLNEDKRLSKTLSYWLRHRPGAADLLLDAQGWADVEAVLAALAPSGTSTNLDRLRTTPMCDESARSRALTSG